MHNLKNNEKIIKSQRYQIVSKKTFITFSLGILSKRKTPKNRKKSSYDMKQKIPKLGFASSSEKASP